MKVTTMFLLLFVINFSIGIFDNTGGIVPESGHINIGNQNYASIQGGDESIGTNKIWNAVINPTDWTSPSSIVWWFIISVAARITAFVIAALATKSYAPDTYLFAGWFAAILSFGSIPLIHLFTFLIRELSSYMCSL